MPHVSGIGTWFAPGSAAAANNASDDIDHTLSPGSSYYGAANTGAAGNAIIGGAANMQNVGANFHPMDSDSAALGALSTNYLHNYIGGGQLTAAQQAQSQADLQQMNSSQLRAGSQKEANAVDSVKQQEDALNASGATSTNAASQALKLKEAAMQMMISHTNNMTAIERQKLQQGVGNVGQNAAEQLQSGADSAHANQASIYESGRMAAAQAAIGIGTGLATAAATAGGAIAKSVNDPVEQLSDSDITIKSASDGSGTEDIANLDAATNNATPVTNTTQLPDDATSQLTTGDSKLALVNGSQTYSPFSSSQSNTAYPMASAWGLTSLNNSLPS